MVLDAEWFAEFQQRIGPTPDATRIFLSHCGSDSGVARALAVLLRRAMGAKWHIFNSADAYTLYPGLPWEQAVTDALGSSNYFVLLLSEDALKSKWVKKEIEIAQEKGVPMAALCYGKLPPGGLPEPFLRIELRSLHDPTDLQSVLGELRKIHREVQGLRSPVWAQGHNAMNDLGAGWIAEFMEQVEVEETREFRTLDPLDFPSTVFPSFEEYRSFEARPSKNASSLAVLHLSKDGDVAQLVAALVRRGAGKNWRISFTEDGTERADVFLLMLSEEAVQSPQVLNAFARALSYKVPVLPCLFGPVTPSDLPDHYGWFQTCRLDIPKQASALLHVLRHLRSDLLGRTHSRVWWLSDLFAGRNDLELSKKFVPILLHHLKSTRGKARPERPVRKSFKE